MDIPEYYQQFQHQPPKKEEEVKKPEQKQETQKSSQAPQVNDKTVLYQGHGLL